MHSKEDLELKDFIQTNFLTLKEDMAPDEIADYLFEKDVIDSSNIERIHETTYRKEKCDVLLKAIVNSHVAKKSSTWQIFVHALERSKCGHLIKSPANCEYFVINDYFNYLTCVR